MTETAMTEIGRVMGVARRFTARLRSRAWPPSSATNDRRWSARFSPDGNSVIYGAGWEGEPLEH